MEREREREDLRRQVDAPLHRGQHEAEARVPSINNDNNNDNNKIM